MIHRRVFWFQLREHWFLRLVVDVSRINCEKKINSLKKAYQKFHIYGTKMIVFTNHAFYQRRQELHSECGHTNCFSSVILLHIMVFIENNKNIMFNSAENQIGEIKELINKKEVH